MKKLLMVITLVLLAGFATSVSDEKTATASVEVNEYLSITVTDNGAAGINFGSLNPGENDTPEIAQNGTGAVTITNDSISNVDVNFYVKGNDFTGAGTLAASNVTYNDSNSQTGELTLANAYGSALQSGVSPGNSAGAWFWLDVPLGQTAGSYNSTFYFKGDTV